MPTDTRSDRMVIEAMPEGGFLVSRPHEAHMMPERCFAATNIKDALAWIEREMVGDARSRSMSLDDFRRSLAKNIGA